MNPWFEAEETTEDDEAQELLLDRFDYQRAVA